MDALLHDSPSYSQSENTKSIPPWVFAVVVCSIPLLGFLSYYSFAFWRRRRTAHRTLDPPTVTLTTSVDIEKQTHDKSRSSIGKWTLPVPQWARSGRRGSDGGFPPETLRIVLPDPTRAASVDSLDVKPPLNPPGLPVISPVTLGYPTPPPPVALQPGRR